MPSSVRKQTGKNLKVMTPDSLGLCSGVKRAIKIALKAAAQQKKNVYTIGPLIHNPQVVEKLSQVGVKSLPKSGRVQGTVIIRSHGVSPEVIQKLKRKGYEVIDATCPFVREAQRNAQKLSQMGYRIVIIGEREHPEVKGIIGGIARSAIVVETPQQLKGLKLGRRVGIIAQTTVPVETFSQIVGEISKKVREMLVFNTICSETTKRRLDARKLAGEVNVVLVVGGKNSANTRRLANLCQSICKRTHHIETACEIKKSWFRKGETVGVVAGASTPKWLVKSIVEKLRAL